MVAVYFVVSLMPRDQPTVRYRTKKHSNNMSSERIATQDDVIYSPRHALTSTTNNNTRNRTRTISGSSSNQDFSAETALLDNGNNDKDDDEDVIEGQGYRERVVILTEHDERDGEEDSGISEAAEEHLLAADSTRDTSNQAGRIEPRKETIWHVAIQVFIPFLIAGFGMMAAGLLLDKVQVIDQDGILGCDWMGGE